MLGEHHVGTDNVPITRTMLRLLPTSVRIAGDPQTFHRLASAIDIAVKDLGDDEWQTRTGTNAETALSFATRLREDLAPAVAASWHQLDATMNEYATARAALVELAYGTTQTMPDGTSRVEVADLLKELEGQLGR